MREVQQTLDTILRHLPGRLSAPLRRAAPFYSGEVREIILRADRPVAVECAAVRYYLTRNGTLTVSCSGSDRLISTSDDVLQTFRSICSYSVYACQHELNNGYITIGSGVRVGVCGTAVENGGAVVNIKDITTLSFRVAREVIGCADAILSKADALSGILVCGAPCSGKTTLIRDMARCLSHRYKVCIIDERAEISAASAGVIGCDIGMADVLVGMRKGEGIIHALRSLSPDIIICDELGDRRDADSLRCALRCGAAFIATVHARDLSDLRSRSMTADLLQSGAFRYLAELSDRGHAGTVRAIHELEDVCY